MKKLLVCILFLMLLLPVVSFSTAVNENNTIYVDVAGGADYTRIQDAIDAARDGDTVFVYSGTYNEQIVINKEISVLGENRDSTIIDCLGIEDYVKNSAIVLISSSNVEFSGFTIQYSNETRPGNRLIGINCGKGTKPQNRLNSINDDNGLTQLSITNNYIKNNPHFEVNIEYGILTMGMFDSMISDNRVDGSGIGIAIYLSSNNEIKNNIVENCVTYGIATHGSGNGQLWELLRYPSNRAENNLITGNLVMNNREGIVLGGSSYNNNVVLNQANNNTIGIITYYNANNNILNNNIMDNTKNGFVYSTRMFHVYSNNWDQNYWGEPLDQAAIRVRRYFLFSGPFFIPLVVYDEHPASEPYEIGEYMETTIIDAEGDGTVLYISEATSNNKQVVDLDICIDNRIKCTTKPFIKGHEEKFSVTINNSGDEEIGFTVNFYLWDWAVKEWEWFGQSICTIPSNQVMDINPDDVTLIWPGCWFQEPRGPQEPPSPLWPGRFRPREIRAELYVHDELVDTQENRFFMGFFIF